MTTESPKSRRGRTCTTCSHPKRAEIEILHAQGTRTPEIAARFDLNVSSLKRHLAQHLHLPTGPVAPSALKALEVREIAEREEILDITSAIRRNRLAQMQSTLEQMEAFRRARGEDLKDVPGGSTGLALRTFKSIRAGVEDYKVMEEIAFDYNFVRGLVQAQEYIAKECGGMFEQRQMPGQVANPAATMTVVMVPQAGSTVNVQMNQPVEMGVRGRLPSQLPGNAVEEALMEEEDELEEAIEEEEERSAEVDRSHYRQVQAREVGRQVREEDGEEEKEGGRRPRGRLWP